MVSKRVQLLYRMLKRTRGLRKRFVTEERANGEKGRRLYEMRLEQTITEVMDNVFGRKKEKEKRKLELGRFLEEFRKCGKTHRERRECMRIRWYVQFFKRPAFISWSVA